MKKKLVVGVLIIMLLIIAGFGYINTVIYNMKNLPKGIYIYESTSPENTFTIKAYYCDGGATTEEAVRCEVISNLTGAKENIYWQYGVTEAYIKWIDENTVEINTHQLELPEGRYDGRKHRIKKEEDKSSKKGYTIN